MLRFLDAAVAYLAASVKNMLTAVLCLCGLAAITALSALAANMAILQPEAGVRSFLLIMNLQGISLVEPLHLFLTVFNWLSLTLIAGLFFRSLAEYLGSLRPRSHSAEIVDFPVQSEKKTALEKTVNS